MESIQQKTIRGTPDLLCCVAGLFVALEIKSEGGKLTALQSYKLQAIIDAGGVGIEVNPTNFEVFKELIEEINNDQNNVGHTKQ